MSVQLKTLFVVSVTTARMIFPGIADMPKIPGVKMPDLSAPTRTLRMDLTSPKAVDSKSKAQVAIPGGLKLGPALDLRIDLPVEETPQEDQAPDHQQTGKEETPRYTMKVYWGCAESVPDGQPKVIETDKLMKSMSPAQTKQMQAAIQKPAAEAEGSHAYWPGADAPKIDKAAAMPGDYVLTTNYCGGTSFTCGSGQDFLAPIDLVGMEGQTDLEKPIKITWKSVPNAKAYLLMAFAGADKEMVTWTSCSSPDTAGQLQSGAIQSAELEKYIEKKTLLPATATSCCIPAGIFKGLGSPMLTVTAYGDDEIQTKDNIVTQVVVRSTATMALGNPESMDSAGDQTSVEPAADDSGSSDSNASQDQGSKDSMKSKLKKVFGGFGRH